MIKSVATYIGKYKKYTVIASFLTTLGIIAMSMMMKAGIAKMGAYYESAKKMNNTIIEYVNGMEAIKVLTGKNCNCSN